MNRLEEIAARGMWRPAPEERLAVPDFDRLVDRAAIARETLDIVERRQDLALMGAEHMTRPRARLVDLERRLVRVRNAPVPARRNPPTKLSYLWTDPISNRTHSEPVAKLAGRPTPLDIDFRVIQGTRASAEFLSLLEDFDMSVTVTRLSSGRVHMLATFDE